MSGYIPALLRQFVFERARGCCEYCGYPSIASFAIFEIDHVVAQKHGGESVEENLALSCPLCNRYKGSDLSSIDPETGAVERLFQPRRDNWFEHFYLEGAVIKPLSATGRVTVTLLQFNRAERVGERAVLVEAGEYPLTKG